MNLSNLIMIVVVILLLGYFMSNNKDRKEDSSKSNDVNSLDLPIENNVDLQNNNSNIINTNISGNNVNLSKESFQPTNNNIKASVESYAHSYLINVDPVKDTNNKYFIELFNPKQKMNGVLHLEINSQPTIATKDSTNMNQHFEFIELTDEEKTKLNITSSDNLITIRKSVGDSTVILKYNGQLYLQPFRDGMNLNIDHVFITRDERKSEGISEREFNRGGEYDKNFNFDGSMTPDNLNYGLYKTVQNINKRVEYLYNKDQRNKELDNESNLLDNKPIRITVSNKESFQNKAPFINSGSNNRSIAEKFQEIDNNKKNEELQNLIQETIVSSNAEIKCPQLDTEKYIHVQDVDCLTCPKMKI